VLSDEVMDVFMNFDWPGNVRQLKNIIERAVVLARGGRITARELPEDFLNGCRKIKKTIKEVKPLKDLELQAINEALLLCGGNKSKAAKQLGISRKTFYKRLKEL
jgi:transcriptional regulator of acetoin/glycerol metabolism